MILQFNLRTLLGTVTKRLIIRRQNCKFRSETSEISIQNEKATQSPQCKTRTKIVLSKKKKMV